MVRTWLVVDVNNLAYRAFHAFGGLEHKGNPTAVYYNVLGTILQLQGRFNTNQCVLCFDSRSSHRKKKRPDYKRSRQEKTPEEMERLWELYQQIDGMRRKYFKQIGFRNVFCRKGFEADDLIASVCQNLPGKDRAVIVSTDADLFQLLSKRVEMYDPRKQFLWTRKIFRQQYGLRNPEDWAIVKALAGCPSDGVKGIRGVGEKTAIKFLNMTLSHTSKAYGRIVSTRGLRIRARNTPLVKLPYEGTKVFKLKIDGTHDWQPTLKELGIKTLNTELVYREAPKQEKS